MYLYNSIKFQVHSWLLLTFIFAFYIQLSNFVENTDQKTWAEACKTKFNNCTKVIITLNTSTELKVPKVLDDCIEFFKNCTQTEPEKNHFNDWKVMFKTLSMSAGELTFDDLPFEDNPIYILTFVLFTILVIFVIMNLMTSLAVNNIQEIRNESRDGTWYKLMFTVKWYHEVLPDCIKNCIIRKKLEGYDSNIISLPLNKEVPDYTKLGTWFNFLIKMPDSIRKKTQGNVQPISDTFSIEHNMDNFEDIVIIFGTITKFDEVILQKGRPHERPVSYWKTKFAIVDFLDGYDEKRKMYRAQSFNVSGSTKLEIKFKPYKGTGQFVVFDQSNPDEEFKGDTKQYATDKPKKQFVDIINKYKIE